MTCRALLNCLTFIKALQIFSSQKQLEKLRLEKTNNLKLNSNHRIGTTDAHLRFGYTLWLNIFGTRYGYTV